MLVAGVQPGQQVLPGPRRMVLDQGRTELAYHRIAVRHLIPNSRVTAATDAPSCPARRQISARARSVSDACGVS